MIAPTTPLPLAVIAEDEDSGRLLLAECASAAGLRPVVFENGRDALNFLLANDVALVLLDVEMPGLDGYAVCSQIRRLSRFALVPIVMVTGRDDKSAINRAFKAGATDFISKPVSWALLPHRLQYILRNASSVRALADREAKLNTLLEAIPDALWVVSPDGQPRWSPNAHRILPQIPEEPSMSLAFQAALPQTIRAQVSVAIHRTATDGETRNVEYRQEDPQGSRCSAELRFSRVDGGEVLVVRRDTSERTAAAENIERLAYYDTLTGLPNRQCLIDTAERFLGWAAKSKEAVALIYIDLNSFKRINDSFGHSLGDVVLKRVADILSSVLQRFATRLSELSLARLGGDEFVILLTDAAAKDVALDVAAACCAALEKPVVIDQLEFVAAPSIGIAVYPEHGTDVEALLKHADTAMYQAKAIGGPSVALYTPVMSARLRDQLDLETRLRRAVREGRLAVRYQPKFRLSDNVVVGVEALSRWYDPELGEIAPSRFIQIAEESNLIVDLAAWLAATVCHQIRGWLDLGITMPVAINVSGKELAFGDPARVIEAQARAWQVPAALIEIEITESVFVADSSVSRRNVEKLRGLGCRIALDDFGTGYSSLAYLTKFPPDRLKIDKSFVKQVDTSEGDGAVVNAITMLAKSLGLVVTAEGVERQSQLEWLRQRGCDEAQGYFLARPLTALDLETQYLLPTDCERSQRDRSAGVI
jgi:diguanylate cyclase (GGDEF)-like protein